MSTFAIVVAVLALATHAAPASAPATLGSRLAVQAATDPDGLTPLMRAAARGDLGQVNALLAKGARLELKDAQGAAAVDWATLGDHPELEKTLTGPGAALNPFLNPGIMPIWLMDKASGQ